jgi:hypothetical protein
MNQRRYRNGGYKRRRNKTIIIISIAAVIALFVIFLIVGLSLAEKTKDYEIEGDEFEETSSDNSVAREVKTVNAYPLPLLEDGSSFSSRLAGIKDGAKSVCVSLNAPDGDLLYRSGLASSFPYLTVKSDASSLSTYTKAIDDEELYVTGTLYIPTFSETEDDLKADIELSIWGSVACEAIRGGIGDVLLITDKASVEDVDRLCALAERIHITEENAIIGLCLPSSIIEAEKSVSLIDKLSDAFDYLAFNATSLPIEKDGTLLESVESAIADMQLQLMYYKMRVLLPRGASPEELDKLADIVTKHSINSWQALPLN